MRRVIIALSSALLLAACANSISPSPSDSESQSNSGSPDPSSTCWRSPLTGQCSQSETPAMVVKIDDAYAARPQYSLNDADLVVVEPVEGGMTRFFAVYQTNAPVIVGPVRSARITDPDIAEAFGVPGFVYSGSNNKVKPLLLNASIQLVGAPQGGKGYYREDGRDAPHNLIGEYAKLVERLKDATAAKLETTSSWNFADSPSAGKNFLYAQINWPGEHKTFTWDAALKQWTIKSYKNPTLSMDGVTKILTPATATTVFIQETHLLPNPTSKLTPYPETFGEGTGYILNGGTVISVVWKRPTVRDLPHWYLPTGEEVSIAPGRVWWAITSERDEVIIKYPKSPSPSASAS